MDSCVGCIGVWCLIDLDVGLTRYVFILLDYLIMREKSSVRDTFFL